jgi:mRNA interferase RelE/StbE
LGWRIEFDLDALKDLERLDPPIQRRITRYLRERLAPLEDPRRLGAPLRGPLSGLWKYRVGDYRVICRLEDAALVVLVVAVGHRRAVYRP